MLLYELQFDDTWSTTREKHEVAAREAERGS
jgi:hypothetical protein